MKRRWQAILAYLVLIFILAACQGQNLASNAGVPGSPQSSVYDRVMDEGVVRIGVRFDNPPLSFITEDGQWVGFDVELANALAEKLGVDIDMVRVDETTRISFLQEGKIDLAVASMNHTRQRDDAVDFSVTYFWDNQSFLVRTDTYSSLDEMTDKKVAANAGSSSIPAWRSFVEQAGGSQPEIVEFTDKLAAMQALRDGAVEGYTEDNITLLALAAGDPGLTLIPGGFNPVQYGIGLPQDDSLWRDQVNYALQELWKDGTYHAIYEKYFLGPDAMVTLPLVGEMEVWPE